MANNKRSPDSFHRPVDPGARQQERARQQRVIQREEDLARSRMQKIQEKQKASAAERASRKPAPEAKAPQKETILVDADAKRKAIAEYDLQVRIRRSNAMRGKGAMANYMHHHSHEQTYSEAHASAGKGIEKAMRKEMVERKMTTHREWKQAQRQMRLEEKAKKNAQAADSKAKIRDKAQNQQPKAPAKKKP